MAYVYLVRRILPVGPLRCSDLICKVGMGTGDRMSAYRTPYGSDGLKVDTWTCLSREEALTLERLILDLLEMRGWLRYHASGRRSEVVSFVLGKDPMNEYRQQTEYLYRLITFYANEDNRNRLLPFINKIYPHMRSSQIPLSKLNLFTGISGTCTSQAISHLFQAKCKCKRSHDIVDIVFSTNKLP